MQDKAMKINDNMTVMNFTIVKINKKLKHNFF